MKLSGKRSAGNMHATFDAEGDGNGVNKTTAPLLDPTVTLIRKKYKDT